MSELLNDPVFRSWAEALERDSRYIIEDEFWDQYWAAHNGPFMARKKHLIGVSESDGTSYQYKVVQRSTMSAAVNVLWGRGHHGGPDVRRPVLGCV